MGLLDSLNLPTLGEQGRCAKPKHSMQTVREERGSARRMDDKQLDAWRKAVARRDGAKCRWCRRRVVETLERLPEQAQTHHATPREHRPTRYDVRNGIRLCGTCHDRITGTVGEKAVIVAGRTFTIDGRAYPDMSGPVNFRVIAGGLS